MEPVNESVRARPTAALRPYVTAYAGYRTTGAAPASHRGLPSPYLTVILTLDDPLLLGGGPSRGLRRFDAMIAGLDALPAHIVHFGSQSGIQLSMTPLGARALLGLPAGALARLEIPADDLLGPAVATLRDRVLGAPTWAERFAVLDSWLSARADHGAVVGSELAQAWTLIGASAGALSMTEVAGAVGWSTRHLRSRMLAEFGVTPKLAARIVRFDRARRILGDRVRAGHPPNLADLAAVGGYADQSHLDRDFGLLAGCPPSIWLAEEFPNVQARRPAPARASVP